MENEPRKKERYEALYEDIKSDVQLVLEGHSLLVRKISQGAEESESRDAALSQ